MLEFVLGLILGGEVRAITAEATVAEISPAVVTVDPGVTPEVQVEVPVLHELLEEG